MDRTFLVFSLLLVILYYSVIACLLDVVVGGWLAWVRVSSQGLTAKWTDGSLLMLATTLCNVVVGVVMDVLRWFPAHDTFSNCYEVMIGTSPVDRLSCH